MTRAYRVLVVEDNDRNQRLFKLLLTSLGHEVLLAADGDEGIRLAREAHPDLVVMDIQMPRVDGISALQALRAEEATRKLPVIAVTSYALPADRERLVAAGFDEYLSKPIDTRRFQEIVTEVLRRTHGDG